MSHEIPHEQPLPTQGSPSYLPALIDHLSRHAHGFPFDRQIFVGLLLCLISQRKNLIVDVDGDDEEDEAESFGCDENGMEGPRRGLMARREEDVVQRVVRMTELITTNIFGLQTLPIRLSSRWTHLDLPSRIIHPTHSHAPSDLGRPTLTRLTRSSTLRSRRRSSTVDAGATLLPRPRSSSAARRQANLPTQSKTTTGLPSARDPSVVRTASSLFSPRREQVSSAPITCATTTTSALPGPLQAGIGLHSEVQLVTSPEEEEYPPLVDPTSHGRKGDRDTVRSRTATISPRSSFAGSSLPLDEHSQREAHRPSSFPAPEQKQNPAIRPEAPTFRPTVPKILIVHNIDEASYDAQVSLYQILQDKSVELVPPGVTHERDDDAVEKGKQDSELRTSELFKGRVGGIDQDPGATKFPLSGEFCCVWVRRRGFRNKVVPTFLIDQFAFSCSAIESARDESGVYAGPWAELDRREMISREHLLVSNRLANKTHLHPPLRLQISDLISAAMHHPQLHSNISSTAMLDMKDMIRVSRIVFRPFEWKSDLLNSEVRVRLYDQRRKLHEAMEREDWFATDEDVRMVWGNLIGHRVELRTEEEEVWAVVRKGGCARMKGREGKDALMVEMGWEERGVSYEETRREIARILKYSLDAV